MTTTLTLIPMEWHHDGPPFFPFFPFMFLIPLLFWGLVATGIIGWRRGGWGRHTSTEQTLRQAYARGEIDEEVFRRRLEVLRETRESRW
jgi:putative membrane protein